MSYLPHFLDGLLKFLGDPTEEIRNATMHILADLLKEVREVAEVARVRAEAKASRHVEKQQKKEEAKKLSRSSPNARNENTEPGDLSIIIPPELDNSTVKGHSRRQSVERKDESRTGSPSSPMHSKDIDREKTGLLDISEEEIQEEAIHPGATDAAFAEENGLGYTDEEDDDDEDADAEGEGAGSWVPGQDVRVDHAAIVDILLQHLSFPGELTKTPLCKIY